MTYVEENISMNDSFALMYSRDIIQLSLTAPLHYQAIFARLFNWSSGQMADRVRVDLIFLYLAKKKMLNDLSNP